MATQVNVHEAKTQLSKLLQRVEAGEETAIVRNGTPVARLAPVEKPAVQLGWTKDIGFSMADEFDAWDDELEEMFFGVRWTVHPPSRRLSRALASPTATVRDLPLRLPVTA